MKFRKILIVLLALAALVLAVLLPASAEETVTEVASDSALSSAFGAGGKIKLTADVTMTAALTVSSGKTVALDLAGHTLNMNGKTFTVSGTFYLYSSVSGAVVLNKASKGVLVSPSKASTTYVGAYPGTPTPDESILNNITFTGSQFVKSSGESGTATVNFYGGSYTYATATSYYSAMFCQSKQKTVINATKATFKMTSFQGAKAYATDAVLQIMNANRGLTATFTDCVISGSSPMEIATSGKTSGSASDMPSTVAFHNCTLTNVALSSSLCKDSTVVLGADTTFDKVTYGTAASAYDYSEKKFTSDYPNYSLPKGYIIEGGTGTRYTVVENVDPVATVDGTPYTSFTKAMAAAIAAGNTKVTVKLLMHTTADATTTLTLNAGFELCLDLAGFTLTVPMADDANPLFIVNGAGSAECGALHIYSSAAGGVVDCGSNLLSLGTGYKNVTLGAYGTAAGDNLTVTCYRIFRTTTGGGKSTVTVTGGKYVSDSAKGNTQDSMFQAQKETVDITMTNAKVVYAQSSSKQFFAFGQVSTERSYKLRADGCIFEGNFTAIVGDNGKGYASFDVLFTNCDFTADTARYRFCQPTGIYLGDGCRLSTIAGSGAIPLADGASLVNSSDKTFPYFITDDASRVITVTWKTLLGETVTEYWKAGDTAECRQTVDMTVGDVTYGYSWSPAFAPLTENVTYTAVFDRDSVPAFFGGAELTDRIVFRITPPAGAGITLTGFSGAGECSLSGNTATAILTPAEGYKPLTLTFTVTIGEDTYEGFERTYSLLEYTDALSASDNSKIAALGEKFHNYVYYSALALDADAAAYFTENAIAPHALAAVSGGGSVSATTYVKGASLSLDTRPAFVFYLDEETPTDKTLSLSFTDAYGRKCNVEYAISKFGTVEILDERFLEVKIPFALRDMNAAVTVQVTGDTALTYSLQDYVCGIEAQSENSDAPSALFAFVGAVEDYLPQTVELHAYDEPLALVPEAIRTYLAAAQGYDTADYSYTIANLDMWNAYDWIPVTLSWSYTHPAWVASASVTYGLMPDLSDGVSVEVGTDSSLSLFGLYAGVTYFWQVTASYSDGETVWTSPIGSFETEAGPRILKVGGVDNVRDVGGWKTLSGVTVKNGLVYRTAKLEKITKDGLAYMRDTLGIKTELDLRTDQDTANMNGGVVRTSSSLGEDIGYIRYSSSQYQSYFNPNYTAKTAAIMRVFTDLDNYPIVFHCMGGADRTGTLAFMLKAILGVSENDLVADYELTSSKTRNCTTSGYDFVAMMRSVHNFAGATLQDKIIGYYIGTLGFTWQEISNIQNIMLTDSAVFGTASLSAITVGSGEDVTLQINLRESEGVAAVTVDGEDASFAFESGALTLTAGAVGLHKGVVTFSDGATLTFTYTAG